MDFFLFISRSSWYLGLTTHIVHGVIFWNEYASDLVYHLEISCDLDPKIQLKGIIHFLPNEVHGWCALLEYLAKGMVCILTIPVRMPLSHKFVTTNSNMLQGRIQDFYLGGGAKNYVPERTLRARNQTHFWQGPRARLRALEALGLF